MKNMLSELHELGDAMVGCSLCKTGASTAKYGTPPRCLWPVEDKEPNRGVIVVGLNPGRAKEKEIQFYKEKGGVTFTMTIEYLRQNGGEIPYFVEMRKFVKAAFGSPKIPIHWTEIAKCELKQQLTKVPHDMRRTCIDHYLRKELEILPKEWPVIAAGRIAFEAMAILCTDRAVIGVPHPTGSFGKQFSSLFTDSSLSREAKDKVRFAKKNFGAQWLGSGKE